MKTPLPVTKEDLEIVERVTKFLKEHGASKSTVSCDKDTLCRVKDFCIELKMNDWFETYWAHSNSHLTEYTRYKINNLVELLKENSLELGITSITRRVYGIIFNARKR